MLFKDNADAAQDSSFAELPRLCSICRLGAFRSTFETIKGELGKSSGSDGYSDCSDGMLLWCLVGPVGCHFTSARGLRCLSPLQGQQQHV